MDYKIYKYRKHIGKLRKIFLWTFMITGILFLMLGIFIEEGILITLGIIFIIYGILINVIYGRLESTEFFIKHNTFVYKTNRRVIEIPFEKITSLDSKSIRYTGGWLLIKSRNEKPIRLTVVVENIGDLIIELKNKLDEYEMYYKYNEYKLNKFFKTSFFADQSWERNGFFLPRIFIIDIIYYSVITVLGIQVSPSFVISMIIATILFIIVYLYVEMYLYISKIKKEAGKNINWEIITYDSVLARNRLKKVLLFTILIYALSIIVPFFFI